jgi:regulator of sigma E protease
MSLIQTIFSFLVALTLLIFIHELGHFAAARACGVKVLRFSVGFGRPLAIRRIGADQTEWVLAAFPLGGYVKMLDEQEGVVSAAESHRAFNRQSVLRRAIIVIAGPAANFILAVALYWLLFVGGVTEPRPFLGAPDQGTPAAEAGLSDGDLIQKLDGESVSTWQEVRWKILKRAVDGETIQVQTLNSRNEISMHTIRLAGYQMDDGKTDPLLSLGLRLFRPDFPPVIGKVVAGQVAERAGLLPDDRVTQIDGNDVKSWNELVSVVRKNPGKALRFGVVRAGQNLNVELSPEAVTVSGGPAVTIGRIGAAPQVPPGLGTELSTTVSHGPFAALGMALVRTADTAWFSLRMIGKMLVGEVSWKNLSGPVTIADYAGQSMQMGFATYIAFLALISISLGVLNLLPVPLMDGGHLMYYAVEAVKGSPLSDRFMELGQRVGLTLLLLLTAFAFFNDINRLISS